MNPAASKHLSKVDQALAQNTANYQVNALAPGNPEVVTRSGPADPVVSARYDPNTNQVALRHGFERHRQFSHCGNLPQDSAPQVMLRKRRLGDFHRAFFNGDRGS